MGNDNWDFSAYDIDFSKINKVAEKSSVDNHADFDLPTALPTDSEKPKEETSIKTEPAAVEPVDSQAPKSVEDSQTKEQPQHAMRKPDPPKKEPSINNKEIAELIEGLEKLADMVNDWISKLEGLRDEAKEKLPKGIRISIHRLHEVTNVFKASKTILETVMEEDTSEVLLALEENKVPSICNRTASTLSRHDERMAEMINTLKEAIDTANPEARTMGRELKQKVLSIHSDTVTLAETMAQFVQAYPDKHGELSLFCRIAALGDEEKMNQIDRAMMLTDQYLVLVADASTMMKALEEKDNETMTDILGRMIDKRSEQKI